MSMSDLGLLRNFGFDVQAELAHVSWSIYGAVVVREEPKVTYLINASLREVHVARNAINLHVLSVEESSRRETKVPEEALLPCQLSVNESLMSKERPLENRECSEDAFPILVLESKQQDLPK
ncbi:hypothetical protein NDU88_003619 [Pleurodeles waltl]|uniref:Uncharacterized protein n=1 Tax=Pleurodeles waltl TaxID=8319 RepID=A0AAV7M7I7_PLEWA|nr:hypothetical protein NDU88_003619 [Pleurodeles waltl]